MFENKSGRVFSCLLNVHLISCAGETTTQGRTTLKGDNIHKEWGPDGSIMEVSTSIGIFSENSGWWFQPL